MQWMHQRTRTPFSHSNIVSSRFSQIVNILYANIYRSVASTKMTFVNRSYMHIHSCVYFKLHKQSKTKFKWVKCAHLHAFFGRHWPLIWKQFKILHNLLLSCLSIRMTFQPFCVIIGFYSCGRWQILPFFISKFQIKLIQSNHNFNNFRFVYICLKLFIFSSFS